MTSNRDRIIKFRAQNFLCQNEKYKKIWIAKLDFMIFILPNFNWRKRIIDAHDMHHVVTKYPCTAKGELQLAAWECGAGLPRHFGSFPVYIFLILIGLLWSPHKIYTAFNKGQKCRSLYTAPFLDQLLETPESITREWIQKTS